MEFSNHHNQNIYCHCSNKALNNKIETQICKRRIKERSRLTHPPPRNESPHRGIVCKHYSGVTVVRGAQPCWEPDVGAHSNPRCFYGAHVEFSLGFHRHVEEVDNAVVYSSLASRRWSHNLTHKLKGATLTTGEAAGSSAALYVDLLQSDFHALWCRQLDKFINLLHSLHQYYNGIVLVWWPRPPCLGGYVLVWQLLLAGPAEESCFVQDQHHWQRQGSTRLYWKLSCWACLPSGFWLLSGLFSHTMRHHIHVQYWVYRALLSGRSVCDAASLFCIFDFLWCIRVMVSLCVVISVS